MSEILFRKDAPLTGGNTRQTYIDLKVQKEKDLTNLRAIHTAMSDTITTIFPDTTYDEWRLINFQGDYFCNVFPIITDSASINEIIQLAKRTAFLYGKSAVVRDKLTGKFFAVYIKKIEFSYTGKILKASVASALQVIGLNKMLPEVNKGWNLTGDDLSEDNFAYFQWDTLGWGAYYKFWPFIKQQDRLLKILGTDAYSYLKKFIYKVSDPTASREEVKAYFDPSNPFLVVSDFDDSLGNRFETLETKTSNSSMTLIEYYKFWEKVYYELLGRRQNTDMKRERNISSEVNASQSNFDVLENDNYIHTLNFVMRLERLMGISIRIAKNEIDGEEVEEESANDI